MWRIAAYSLVISMHATGVGFLAASIIWLVKTQKDIISLNNLIFFPAVYGLGLMIGIFFIWVWVRLLILKNNGYPFKVGDVVKILKGPNRNKVVTIYELWDSRRQVRVYLGGEFKKNARDVFRCHEILKVNGNIKSESFRKEASS